MKMPTPLRIQRLTLTDFRAFPGPAPAHFDFDGKNLLIYGENGAGKSSIFHALKGFFALRPPDLRKHKNVFSAAPDNDCTVSVHLPL
jgi:DNA repair exonuclease SbcCD ATPase subunit